MRTWLTDWKYEWELWWVLMVFLIVSVAAAVLWNVMAWEFPRYTVHENAVTGQVHVELHDRADRHEWRTQEGVHRDRLKFSTVKEACKWVKVRHALHDKTDLINDSWKEVKCVNDKAYDSKKR